MSELLLIKKLQHIASGHVQKVSRLVRCQLMIVRNDRDGSVLSQVDQETTKQVIDCFINLNRDAMLAILKYKAGAVLMQLLEHLAREIGRRPCRHNGSYNISGVTRHGGTSSARIIYATSATSAICASHLSGPHVRLKRLLMRVAE